jgi:hypothetical protein
MPGKINNVTSKSERAVPLRVPSNRSPYRKVDVLSTGLGRGRLNWGLRGNPLKPRRSTTAGLAGTRAHQALEQARLILISSER